MYVVYNEISKKVVLEPSSKKMDFVRNGLKIAEVDTLPSKYDYLTVINEQTKNRVVKEAYIEKVIEYDDNCNEIEKEILHEEVTETYNYCELVANFKSKQEKAKAQAKIEIAELKKKLIDTDYQAIKYAEGWMTEEGYAPIKAERQACRDRINELETLLRT